jgi:hypothetical protein
MKYPMKVRVYFNLRKRRFSVLSKQARGWLLMMHTDYINLTNAEFKVSEAGRQRVLREKRKNVHAFVEGFVTSKEDLSSTLKMHAIFGMPIIMDAVSYNPYKAGTFMQGEAPIHTAKLVTLTLTFDREGNRKPAINVL